MNIESETIATRQDGVLLLEERRRHIRELVFEKSSVSTDELAARFRTSLVTIRGDLKALADAGVLVRTHGGAIALRDNEETPINVKQTLHLAEKSRIADAAAELISPGETILLDSGTTTGEIAKRIRMLPLNPLTVITNALNVAATLASAAHVRLVMLGGVLRPQSYSMAGPIAEAALAGLHADRLFLGVDSLDPEVGLMTPHLFEAQLNAQMIRSARHVVAVADSSKLTRRSLSVIARIEQIHMLITDSHAPYQVVEALRQRGLKVKVV